jgi:hypothetical protein
MATEGSIRETPAVLRRAGSRACDRVMLIAAVTLVAGCDGDGFGPGGGRPAEREELICNLDLSLLADGGVGRDGIPPLDDPAFVPVEPIVPENSYMKADDRVIGVFENGEWLAIPHNIMWRHEIVNLPEVTVTYCPLTGSALAFARLSVDGAGFGVSGLLYQANLVLYDRNEPDESLWPQMWGEARCGPRTGQSLQRVPVVEMTWSAWRALHPDSKVVALPSVFDPALYFFNPYGFDYETPGNPDYLGFPIPLDDDRLLPKERVLGIPDGDAGGPLAFGFSQMAAVADRAVFDFEYQGSPAVVFWDADRAAAVAFRSVVDGRPARFEVMEAGFRDDLDGTVWTVDGTPIEGGRVGTGSRLRPLSSAYVAFWAAWAAFHPGTELPLEG